MSRVIFLTSDSLRHKYIAAQLSEYFDLKLIITEKKSIKIEDTTDLTEEDAAFTAKHFKARAESESSFFSAYTSFPKGVKCVNLEHRKINTEAVLDTINKVKPHRIILFGTSIIKNPLLQKYTGKIINLHLGLSPYYKGSATNLFPVIYNEISCIGATIHIVNEKVDQGPILHQLRPEIKTSDILHDLGNKVIHQSGKELPVIIQKHIDKASIGVIQTQKGKVFRLKNLTTSLLRKAYINIEKGAIDNYLKNKEATDKEYPIITLL
ncbi:formyl transferase-like protein [Lutibacter sp. Hel_I_33_5]|uniref:formyltransferase family protein n=1 Tax=Lutibacter sp. Hel_I_33_5 TaxID=1566289 RepID=UPI0011A14535|nr:formyltransferase family protein [Lutibacter sp. Hel_I_33_5]TVZ54861.1 formyl transferase-like protein [Lutibacter sp. Hel_I_33_5]